MRDLEFRAWDIKNKSWIYSTHLPKTESQAWFWDMVHEYGCIVEQFTGLYDKNGKKIFEGDIIKSKHHNPSIFKVEFLEGGFCATYGDEDSSMPIDINHFFDSTGCMIEVIGNIREHSDLLNYPKGEHVIP